MSGGQLSGLLRYLRTAAAPADAGGTSDGQLLERFVTRRDEVAYGVLLRRHGPMVLGTCLRILNNVHDAEDAFQATFLVLARKASSIDQRESVGGWLYRIAYRTAQRAKAEVARRRAHEGPLVELPAAADAVADLAWQELRPVLDEELSRLSEKYRGPVILCYLEEKTYAQAAKVLGLPEGTVSSRLARARDVLRKRLSRRGFALSSGLLTTLMSQHAFSAALPVPLIRATTKAALRFVVGETAAAGAVSAPVAALTQGVLQAMFMTQLKMAASLLLAVGLIGISAGVLAHRALADRQVNPQKQEAIPAAPHEGAKPQGEKKPRPQKAFENEFGYSWQQVPEEMQVEPGSYSLRTLPGGMACTFALGRNGELLLSIARAQPMGQSAPTYRPVAFDANRTRLSLCQPVAGGNLIDGAYLSMALWCSDAGAAEKVRYVGIEVLKPEGRKAIAARAIARAKEAGIEVLPPGQIGEVYDFALTSMEGKKIRASDLRGKVVVIDCWATWCSPCMAKMPQLKSLYEKHHKDALEIIGVSLDADAATVQKACQAHGLTWPQVLVPVDETARKIWYQATGLRSIPRLLVLDRDGILRADGGPKQLEEEVRKLLERPSR